MKNLSLLLARLMAGSSLLLAVCICMPAHAQPTSGGPTPGADPTAIPLDGGVSLLLAGGVAYGLKQLRTRRQARRSGK
ncbi:MAG: hypothetical protein JWR44_2268 [Hymenobacter sp.]|jgi:hypothetical protein|nr:hypothetical protein [Hymenobacter sp.]